MRKDLVSKYISEAAKRLVKHSDDSYREVSQKLGISYGFFRQLMSNNRDLTTTDIYKLAKLENKPVSYFFPPIEDTKKSFNTYRLVMGNKSHKDFKKFLNDLNL